MDRKPTYEELEQRVHELEKKTVMGEHDEAWLSERQKEISVILGNIPLIMVLVDQDRRVTKLSDTLKQFTKRKEEEIIGMRGGEALRCIHHKDDPKGCGSGPICSECPLRRLVLNTFRTGNIYRKVEAKFSFEDDEIEQRTLLLSTALIDISDKKVLVCIEDITDRVHAEEKIKENNKQLKEMNKKLMDAYALMRDWKDRLGMQIQGEELGFLLNKNGVIVGVTQRAVEVTGRKRVEMIGTNIVDLMKEESKEKFKNVLNNAWGVGFLQTKVDIIFNSSDSKNFKTKLMHMNMEGERTFLVLMQGGI